MVHHQFQASMLFTDPQWLVIQIEWNYPAQIGGRTLKFLDCSGNDRAAHLVKARGWPLPCQSWKSVPFRQEWFARTQWVFVVYSLTDTRLGCGSTLRPSGAACVKKV